MDNMAIKILGIGNSLENLSSLKTLIIEAFPSGVVLSALDGQSGLAAAAKEDPAVIVIDTQITGMDGFGFCRKLKSNRACAGIPIILLIPGKGKKESRKRALECGADAFLTMPIDKSELTAQIRAMIKIKNSSIEKQGEKLYHAASAKGRSWKLNRSDAETLRLLEAIKNEQALNEAILDSIQGYLFVYDENGRLIKWNKKHETMTGYSAEELSHMTLEKWFDGEDIVKVNAAVRDVFVKGYGEVEAQLLLKNGNKLMTRSSGVPFNINGKKFFAGIGVDITEQKRAEQQLKQSMKDLLESQRIAKLGTWRLDLSTNEVVWSEELYKMYNFDPALPPPPYTEHMKLFTPESWNRLSTSLERTRTSGIPYELELETVTKGGSNGWMWVRGEAERDPEGNIRSLWGAAQDITEHKRREREIKQSEERFQLLFNKAPLGYQSLDYDGNFIDVNQQWLDTLGYRKEEVIGKWFGDFLCPEYIEGFRKRFPIFKSQGFIHSEFEMRHKAGRRMTIAFEGKIGYNKDGTFKQTHCILQDITSQRMAEQALADSEERYRCLFEYSGVGIGYFTKSG